eukprot:1029643-Prymnesium_polylepis.2
MCPFSSAAGWVVLIREDHEQARVLVYALRTHSNLGSPYPCHQAPVQAFNSLLNIVAGGSAGQHLFSCAALFRQTAEAVST